MSGNVQWVVPHFPEFSSKGRNMYRALESNVEMTSEERTGDRVGLGTVGSPCADPGHSG